MARADWMSIGLCLLAVVLVDAVAPRTSLAAEAPAKSEHQPALESKGDNGDHAAGGGTGKPAGNATNSSGQESERSDSHIAVEPHGPPPKREDGKGPKAPLRSFTHGNLQTHRLLATQPSGPVVRNAIGVTVGPVNEFVHREGRVAPPAVHSPAAAAGVSTRASSAIAIHETNTFVHQTPTLGVLPPRPGTISGTGLVQRGSGPSQIGGPAKSVAGISGTNVRPKH